MTEPANATETRDGGLLAPRPDGKPTDHCFRCGVETPPGVGLCEEHNPNQLKGPSSTQMHATIFGGIVLGVLGFFVVARLAVGSTGPYGAEVAAATVDSDGAAAVTLTVTNEGDSEGVADCRITRDGVPRPDDMAFRTGRVAPGATVTIERQLGAPAAGTQRYDPEAITVICS